MNLVNESLERQESGLIIRSYSQNGGFPRCVANLDHLLGGGKIRPDDNVVSKEFNFGHAISPIVTSTHRITATGTAVSLKNTPAMKITGCHMLTPNGL